MWHYRLDIKLEVFLLLFPKPSRALIINVSIMSHFFLQKEQFIVHFLNKVQICCSKIFLFSLCCRTDVPVWMKTINNVTLRFSGGTSQRHIRREQFSNTLSVALTGFWDFLWHRILFLCPPTACSLLTTDMTASCISGSMEWWLSAGW